jgi:surface antigen
MQRAWQAMTHPHWPVVTALALALGGCHAIYGHDRAPPASAAVETPTPLAGAGGAETPSGGSGATVTVGVGVAAASFAGTLAGGRFGTRLGSQFDETARQTAASAERRALADNAPTDWRDTQSGVSGRVEPLRSFTDAAGRQCREYSQAVTIAGRTQRGTGIACRQSSGDWSLVGS